MDSLSDLYVIFECKLVLMVEADEINGRLITGLTVVEVEHTADNRDVLGFGRPRLLATMWVTDVW